MNRRLAPILLASLAAVALGQAAVLQHAFSTGRLSGLLPWDDCAIVDRMLWTFVGITSATGPRELIQAIRDAGPRGPLAEFQTLAGLLISDGNPVVPYFLNWWAAALAVCSIIWAGRNLGRLTLVALVALVVVQPFVLESLFWLKADHKAGVLIAAGIFVLHEAALSRDRRTFYLGASLMSLAVMAKLTAFFLPIWAIGALLVFEVRRGIPVQNDADGSPSRPEPRRIWRDLWRERWRLTGGFSLVLVPFVLLFAWGATRDLLPYIAYALSDAWSDGLTVTERASFYLAVAGNGLLLETALLVGAAVWQRRVVASTHTITSAATTYLPAAGLIGPFVLAGTSGAEYGALIAGGLLGGALVLLRMVADVDRRWAVAMLSVVCAIAWLTPRASDPAKAAARREAKATIMRVVDRIVDLHPPGRGSLRVLFEDGVAGYPNLSILHFERTGQPLEVFRVDYLEPVERFERDFAGATAALTLVPTGLLPAGYDLSHDRYPASAALVQGDRLVAAQPGWNLIQTYPWQNAELRLYAPLTVATPTP